MGLFGLDVSSFTSRPKVAKSSLTKRTNCAELPPTGSSASPGNSCAPPDRSGSCRSRCSAARRSQTAFPPAQTRRAIDRSRALSFRLLRRSERRAGWRARLRGLRKESQRAGLVVGDQRRGSERPKLHMSAEQIVDGLPPPRYGICSSLIPAILANHCTAMCCGEPSPLPVA